MALPSNLEELQRRMQGVPRGPLQPIPEVMASPVAPGPATGQSLFGLIAAPVLDTVAKAGTGKARKLLKDDKSFIQFEKSNPEMASKLLQLLDMSPAILGGMLTSARGVNNAAGSIIERMSNLPGQTRELMKRIRTKDKDLDSLLDVLIQKNQLPTPQGKVGPMSSKDPNDVLDMLLRR